MRRIVWTAVAVMAASVPGAYAQAGNDAQLTKVLSQMDAASAKFHSAQASFVWDQYTAVVQEHDIQKGTIAFNWSGKNIQMVTHVLTDNGQPAPKDVLYKNGTLEYYVPTIKQETVFSSGGANRSSIEEYATLGFGSSGKELQANWNVIYGGSDTINGTAVQKLTLTPKNSGPNDMFNKVEIWVDPTTATSLKQVLYQPSGDTRTATYTDVKMNSVPSNAFSLAIPKGTQIIRK